MRIALSLVVCGVSHGKLLPWVALTSPDLSGPCLPQNPPRDKGMSMAARAKIALMSEGEHPCGTQSTGPPATKRRSGQGDASFRGTLNWRDQRLTTIPEVLGKKQRALKVGAGVGERRREVQAIVDDGGRRGGAIRSASRVVTGVSV